MSDMAVQAEPRMLSRFINALIVEFYKKILGKGPNCVKVNVVDNIMFYDIKGTLTTLEKRLLDYNPGNGGLIKSVREQLVSQEGQAFLAELRRITGKTNLLLKSQQLEFDYDNDRLVGFVIFNLPLE